MADAQSQAEGGSHAGAIGGGEATTLRGSAAFDRGGADSCVRQRLPCCKDLVSSMLAGTARQPAYLVAMRMAFSARTRTICPFP
mmetsp:Transcript_44764/g.91365  ORF Transcript_44764/g.91365 Transcript_44764/m.91365 type:complete len:84 (-) Transcript_44764:149-400(-)